MKDRLFGSLFGRERQQQISNVRSQRGKLIGILNDLFDTPTVIGYEMGDRHFNDWKRDFSALAAHYSDVTGRLTEVSVIGDYIPLRKRRSPRVKIEISLDDELVFVLFSMGGKTQILSRAKSSSGFVTNRSDSNRSSTRELIRLNIIREILERVKDVKDFERQIKL